MRERIDSLKDIDLSGLTFDRIRWKYGTGIDESTGKRDKKVFKYRNGVMTEIGDVELSIWCKLAEGLIEREGEKDLLLKLIKYLKEKPYPMHHNQAETYQYALELHISRIFDNPAWVDYIPFNRKHRPEAVGQKQFIHVSTPCCQKPGEITSEQIRFDGSEKKTFCPHCGRFIAFEGIEHDVNSV